MTASEPRVVELTRRQRDVIGELALDGADNATIAQRLDVSLWTVKCHLKSAMRATGHTNRTALAVDLLRGRVRVRTVSYRRSA